MNPNPSSNNPNQARAPQAAAAAPPVASDGLSPFAGLGLGVVEDVELVDNFYMPGEVERLRTRFFTTRRKDWPALEFLPTLAGMVVKKADGKHAGAAVCIPWANIRGVSFAAPGGAEAPKAEEKAA